MFDAYTVQARLAVAALAAVPIFLAALVYFSTGFSLEAGGVALALLLGCGFLISLLISNQGGEREIALFKDWGGNPAVQFMRHSDTTIDKKVKALIYTKLNTKAGVTFPDEAAESKDPAAADAEYRKAVDWLRNNTRDREKFPTVVARNVEYGFLRNAYAANGWAVGIAIAVALVVLVTAFLPQEVRSQIGLTSSGARLQLTTGITLFVCLMWGAGWSFYFTASRVKSAAWRYATTLLEQHSAV